MVLLPTVIICITVLVSLILILKTIEKLYTPLPPQELPDIPDIEPLKQELLDIKTKIGSMQVAQGFTTRR